MASTLLELLKLPHPLAIVTMTDGARVALRALRLPVGGHQDLDETSQDTGLLFPDKPLETDLEDATQSQVVLPADGRFAGSFQGYIVIPQPLVETVVLRTEADPAAFGSYAAMGPFGSFELRRSDVVTSSALSTWTGVNEFFYAREKHLQPILEELGIPIIPLKKDFLHAYERVITELGQL